MSRRPSRRWSLFKGKDSPPVLHKQKHQGFNVWPKPLVIAVCLDFTGWDKMSLNGKKEWDVPVVQSALSGPNTLHVCAIHFSIQQILIPLHDVTFNKCLLGVQEGCCGVHSFSSSFQQPRSMHIRLTCDSKLSVCVRVTVAGRLILLAQLRAGDACTAEPRPRPPRQLGQAPAAPLGGVIENGWMDLFRHGEKFVTHTMYIF